MIADLDRVHVVVGKKVLTFDVSDKTLDRAALIDAACRNGKLRAPAIRKGRTLVVGFDDETYGKLFG